VAPMRFLLASRPPRHVRQLVEVLFWPRRDYKVQMVLVLRGGGHDQRGGQIGAELFLELGLRVGGKFRAEFVVLPGQRDGAANLGSAMVKVREHKALIAERVRHVNRIQGFLFSQGISGYQPLRRDRRQRLVTRWA
jgi:hypothetical protein